MHRMYHFIEQREKAKYGPFYEANEKVKYVTFYEAKPHHEVCFIKWSIIYFSVLLHNMVHTFFSFSFCFIKCSILCCLALGLGLENNESCQKRSSLGVGADGGCSHQSCRLVCVPWHGTRCTSRRRPRSSMPETILFPIWPCALVSQSEHDDS